VAAIASSSDWEGWRRGAWWFGALSDQFAYNFRMSDLENDNLLRIKALRMSINGLVEATKRQGEQEIANARSSALFRAELEALHSIIVELAESMGISPQKFDRHYQIRVGYFLEKRILALGDGAPEAADLLLCDDFRELLAEAGPFPSVFDEPPEPGTTDQL